MDLKFSAHTYFMMRNSNLKSVSTENQHEILMKIGNVYYLIGLFFLSFNAEQGGLILFFSSGLTTPLITPVTQVRFTYKILQILLEESKQEGEDNDLLFAYDDPAYYLSQPISQY